MRNHLREYPELKTEETSYSKAYLNDSIYPKKRITCNK